MTYAMYSPHMPSDKRSEAARKAAAARWGPPRSVKLSDLTEAQRRLVLALIEAQREANRITAEVRTDPPAAVRRGVVKLSDFPPEEQDAIRAAIAAKKAAKRVKGESGG